MSSPEGPSPNQEAKTRAPVVGGCACGGVRYEVRGRLTPVAVCHCSQCRKFHGAPGPYTMCKREKFALTAERTLRWYASSPGVRRGFCGECGASLFWDRGDSPFMDIAAGSLEGVSGLATTAHIFVTSRADWEHLEDGLPRHDQGLPNT